MEGERLQAMFEHPRVLLLGSPTEIAEDGLCHEMLAAETPAAQHVIRITYSNGPAAVVDDWLCHHDDLPSSLVVICPENQTSDRETLPDCVAVRTVSPGDLTGIGIAVLESLDDWDDGSITACLDSPTAMLQYVETEPFFRFLHTITGRFMAADARIHVHLDPSAQDDQTIATLSTLFDSVVHRQDGDWTARQS